MYESILMKQKQKYTLKEVGRGHLNQAVECPERQGHWHLGFND
jgi:hypothetical protein